MSLEKIALKTTVFMAIILACLFELNLLLHFFKPFYFCDNSDMYQYDKELQFIAKKNYRHLQSKDYQEEYLTNSLGTNNLQDDFSQYKYKVFTIGDSYTQGIGLPFDASYPMQLDLELNLAEGSYRTDYAVINLGLSAYGGEQYLLTLKKHIKVFGPPNYILLLGCWNDYADDMRFQAFQRGETSNLIAGHPYLDFVIKPLSWVVYETELGKRAFWLWKNYSKKTVRQKAGGDQPNEFLFASQQVKVYTEINQIARELNATFILSWANVDPSYAWLKNWCAAQNIPFADWQPALISVIQHIPKIPIDNPHSGGHYRVWANHLIAQTFAGHIRKAAPPPPVTQANSPKEKNKP